ncbi:MAG: diacylglycerol kinase, partial [Ottowia sp.]|nr:diacylglycerol kinase [Ottowia sp.]
GLARILGACRYSWAGLRAACQHEAAFRQELLCAVVLAPLALWLGETGLERAVLLASLVAVLVVELLNSGLEAIVDLASPEIHPLAGRAKDVGSAAVALAIGNVLIVWALVLLT